MSWTNQCTESSEFKVKNTKEVVEVLEKVGFDVYDRNGLIQFYGGSDVWFDEDIEVVLSLQPITIDEEVKNLVGLSSDSLCDSIIVEDLEEDYGLAEGQYEVTPIIEYLQDQLLDGEHISITCSGFEERSGGSYAPYGDVTVITKNGTNFACLSRIEEKLVDELLNK